MTKHPATLAVGSLASLLLTPMAGDIELAGAATGFLVAHEGKHWLVSNWHVMAGRRMDPGHPDDGQPLSSTGATPDRLRVLQNGARVGRWVERFYDLLDADGSPRWMENDFYRRRADVAALPMEPEEGVTFYPYPVIDDDDYLVAGVSESVSIIGFPFGRTGGGGTGIWARGAIATEPAVDFGERPVFLVDSRTRKGQSGSPVVLYAPPGAPARVSSGQVYATAYSRLRLLGIYSGRISEESDLGMVWRREIIEEIVVSGVPGNGALHDPQAYIF